MILREQSARIKDPNEDFKHKVTFDLQIEKDEYFIFNIRPCYTEDGDEFYFSSDEIKAVI